MKSNLSEVIFLILTIILSLFIGIAIGLDVNKFHPSNHHLQINYIRDNSIHYLFLDVTEKSPYYFEVNGQEEFTEYLNCYITEIFDYDSMRKEL